MNDQNLQNRNEVKSIKFHHRVKRFYHKNLFRKIYTVAILGLVVANIVSLFKYQSFAEGTEGTNCTFKGVTITGDYTSSITVYRNAMMPHGTHCDDDNHNYGNLRCYDGKFKMAGGDFNTEEEVVAYGYGFTSCTVEGEQSCEFRYNGENVTINHGESKTFRPYATVVNQSCDEITATCYDGSMKVSEDSEKSYGYGYGDGVCNAYCSFKGETIIGDDTSSITVYRNAMMPHGTHCDDHYNDAYLRCYDGKFKMAGGDFNTEEEVVAYGYGFTSCAVEGEQSCEFRYNGENVTINHGESKTFRPYATVVNQSCDEITATCYDGSMKVSEDSEKSYGYGYGDGVCNAYCSFKGETITGDNNSYIYIYRNATVPYGTPNGCKFDDGQSYYNFTYLRCENGKFRINNHYTFNTEEEVEAYGYGFTSCTEEAPTYTITWKDSDGGVLKTDELEAGSMPSYTPTKAGHRFLRWTPDLVAVEGDAIYTAVWEEISNNTTPSYSGRGGRGGSSSSDSHKSADTKDTTVDKNDTNVDKNDTEISEKDKSENKADGVDTSKTSNTEPKGQRVIEFDMQKYNYTYTPEQNLAYQFAYQNKITTVPTIREAKMNTPLTRIEMAKMLSYYAMNVLGQIPDASIGVVKFRDVTDKMDDQYDNGVTLAYQLGIMGINMPNREFRPNDTVTRGEFATALSRMIYNDVKDGTGKVKYYEPHIAKLYKEGIINNTNPKLKELRGYVMTMLMRTSK